MVVIHPLRIKYIMHSYHAILNGNSQSNALYIYIGCRSIEYLRYNGYIREAETTTIAHYLSSSSSMITASH